MKSKISFPLLIKTALTFMVPYLVASFSSVRSQLRLKPGHIIPETGIYRCEDCLRNGTIHDVHLDEGQGIPSCSENGVSTKLACETLIGKLLFIKSRIGEFVKFEFLDLNFRFNQYSEPLEECTGAVRDER